MKLSPRFVWWAVLIVAVLFALQGGQYSTLDLLRHSSRTAALVSGNDSLRLVIDSLALYRKALDSDPLLQERLARERYGYIKDRELVYRVIDSLPPR